MKEILSFVLALAMVLSLCACGEDTPAATEPVQTTAPTEGPTEPTVCPHEAEVVQTIPASCTNAGLVISSCTLCGEEFTEELPAPGHSFTAANCTAGPICTVCGHASGNALGHVYIDGICIHCGDELPQDVPADCEHDFKLTNQTAPTCTATGSLSYLCGKCGHAYTETIAANGHRYSEATCTASKTCLVCAAVSGEALGHSYMDGSCARCGALDPSASIEVTYTVTVRSDKGVLIEGVTVSIYTDADAPAAVGRTDSKGVATMTLMSAASYKIILSDIPAGYAAKESYSFRSTTVNINLSTVSEISPTDHSKANYKVGSTMGEFTLTDTDGNTYTLSALLKEKDLVILDFWFVNCGPCKAEFPYFEAVYQKYDNVQLLTMNHIDTEDQIIALREQMGVTFPMIAENIGLQQGFGLYAYPTTVFIDSSGKILKIKVGDFKDQAELEAMIEGFLK